MKITEDNIEQRLEELVKEKVTDIIKTYSRESKHLDNTPGLLSEFFDSYFASISSSIITNAVMHTSFDEHQKLMVGITLILKVITQSFYSLMVNIEKSSKNDMSNKTLN